MGDELLTFLNEVIGKHDPGNWDERTHYHKCPQCGNVWGHTRAWVRALPTSALHDAAHTCGKCGKSEDYFAIDHKPAGIKLGKSMAEVKPKKVPKAASKSDFLNLLESL